MGISLLTTYLEPEPLIAFPCSHTFHLSCLTLIANPPPLPPRPQSPTSPSTTDKDPARLTTFPTLEDPPPSAHPLSPDPELLNFHAPDVTDLSIGPKVRFASELQNDGRIHAKQGCPLAVHNEAEDA
jgi:hypothetical protein